jgi:hypothetical protein
MQSDECTMKRLILAMIAALFVAVLTPTADRAQGQTPRKMIPGSTPITFRLQVIGRPAAGATFWVAYGPLAGQFGIFQLHASGQSTYTATQRLPVQGRTVFAYLAGHRVMPSRLGPVPGDPVITIRHVGPTAARQLAFPVVQWQAPQG